MTRYDRRERLLAYITRFVENDRQIDLHMALLEPFFVHVENQRYTLASRAQCEDQHRYITSAIQRATEGSHVSIHRLNTVTTRIPPDSCRDAHGVGVCPSSPRTQAMRSSRNFFARGMDVMATVNSMRW